MAKRGLPARETWKLYRDTARITSSAIKPPSLYQAFNGVTNGIVSANGFTECSRRQLRGYCLLMVVKVGFVAQNRLSCVYTYSRSTAGRIALWNLAAARSTNGTWEGILPFPARNRVKPGGFSADPLDLHRCTIREYFGYSLHDLICVVAHGDDGVGAVLRRVKQEQFVRFFSRLFAQFR